MFVESKGVGKSCILKRLISDEFKEDHDVTVGVEFGAFMVKVANKTLKLQIWDTAGQESFRSITKIFYRGSHAVFLTYSIVRRDSFENLHGWLKEIRAQCLEDVMIILVANKSDLEDERMVQVAEALAFKKENGFFYFIETSAKSGDNIFQSFTDIAKFLYLKYKDKLDEMTGEDGLTKQTKGRDYGLERGGRLGVRGVAQERINRQNCKC